MQTKVNKKEFHQRNAFHWSPIQFISVNVFIALINVTYNTLPRFTYIKCYKFNKLIILIDKNPNSTALQYADLFGRMNLFKVKEFKFDVAVSTTNNLKQV